jgi:hypothetical protein
VQPTRQRRARRKPAAERPKQYRLHMSDIIDCTEHEGLWRRCRCGGSRFEVMSDIGGHAG